MSRRPVAKWVMIVSGGLAASFVAGAASEAGGVVTLQATSATVQNPGDTGRICVVLNTGGRQIAGTQNKLVWDGTCATLTAAANCTQVGSHGKNVVAAMDPQNDFAVRVLVLSLGDVNPIPDGPLYCCAFESESDPGGCCNIKVVDALASGPNPSAEGAIPVEGSSTAKLCTAPASNQPPRDLLPPAPNTNTGPGGGMESGATTSAPQPAPPARGGAPPVQVLPGGGARVENPAAADVPGSPPVQAATPALGQAPTPPAAGAPPATGVAASALPPPTAAAASAPTSAATKPAPPDTPTVRASSAPPTAATKAAAAKPQQAMPPADTASDRGLFGCQIAGASGGVPLVGFGLLALVVRAVRRRARRKPGSRTQ